VSHAPSAETLRFAKYEGLGNDFVVVDADAPDALDASLTAPSVIAALCERHRGVGADGVLLTGVRGGVPFMRVLNADGSEPEMCGNGLRCVALHLARTGRLAPRAEGVVFDTGAGPHAVWLREVGEAGVIEVQMRAPSLAPSDVPVRATAPLVEAPFELDGRVLRVTAVSMGNPHVVIFGALTDELRLALGPTLAVDARFPEGVNVGFATLTGGELRLRVYERGVGWTQACGTGACAAAVAAVETGRAARGHALTVVLPGGALVVRVGDTGERVHLTGPARHVFDGELALASYTPARGAS
jgi:diaminopimelate epimerase